MHNFATTEVHAFPIEDSLVLVPVGRPGLLLLNATSRRIWEMLRAGTAATDIVSWLSTTFGISKETAEHDVTSTIAEWEKTFLADAPPEQFSILQKTQASDRYREPSAYDYVIHDRRFRFLIDDPELEEEIAHRFAPLQAHKEGFLPEFVFHVARDELGFLITDFQGRAKYSGNSSSTRMGLIQEIMSVCFPEKQWLAALHAAAIGTADRCVLFSACTGGGKSTLSAALAGSGLELITDDLVFIDSSNLEASAIPLAIMLREGSWPVLRSSFPEIDSLPVCSRFGVSVRFMHAASKNATNCTPVALLFLDYRIGSKPELKPLTTFDALIRLHETQSWVDNVTSKLQRFIDWMERIPKFQLVYPDLAAGEAMVREILSPDK